MTEGTQTHVPTRTRTRVSPAPVFLVAPSWSHPEYQPAPARGAFSRRREGTATPNERDSHSERPRPTSSRATVSRKRGKTGSAVRRRAPWGGQWREGAPRGPRVLPFLDLGAGYLTVFSRDNSACPVHSRQMPPGPASIHCQARPDTSVAAHTAVLLPTRRPPLSPSPTKRTSTCFRCWVKTLNLGEKVHRL